MSKNKGRKYLDDTREHIRYANENITAQIERLADLKIGLECLSTVSNGDRIQSSGNFDKIADTIARISELEYKINLNIDALTQFKDLRTVEIKSRINNSKYQDALIDRYVNDKSDGQMALENHCTDRGIRKRTAKAIDEFERSFIK